MNKNKEKEAKELVFKKYFSSSSQKRIITKAAKASAKDQRDFVKNAKNK